MSETPRYSDGRTYAYLGKRERFTDHIGAVPGSKSLTCGAVALGAVGDCTRAAGHDGAHQNGATADTFEIGAAPLAVSNVKPSCFRKIYDNARHDFPHIAAATSECDTTPAARGTRYFLWSDGVDHAGFAIRADGELVYVFSTARGKGDALVETARSQGADHLDCFDGSLPELYGRNGFVRVASLPNWTPGGPDVVYMGIYGSGSDKAYSKARAA